MLPSPTLTPPPAIVSYAYELETQHITQPNIYPNVCVQILGGDLKLYNAKYFLNPPQTAIKAGVRDLVGASSPKIYDLAAPEIDLVKAAHAAGKCYRRH